jgi:hypothetical protein
MHPDPDEVILEPEKESEDCHPKDALNITGQDEDPERETLKTEGQNGQENQK